MFYKYDTFKKALNKAWVCRRVTFFNSKRVFEEEEIYPND
jgi:hypothetical protein